MRVPENIGNGKAKITLSFPGCKVGDVSPATFEVPIQSQKPTDQEPNERPTPAVDLTKIDRTIAKEPAYKNKPKYCLLVFGQEAKTRVWLALDGDVLYVDRNGNGDLTEKEERCPSAPQDETDRKDGYRTWLVGDIVERDGNTRHTGLKLTHSEVAFGLSVMTHGRRHEYTVGDGLQGRLQFGERPQDAPVVHFAGPLGVRLRTKVLSRGTADELWAALGTPGLGPGTFAAIFDDKLYLQTELVGQIEFPAKDAGAEPIKVKVTLERL